MPQTITYRCPDCRRIMRSGHHERWCKDCGAELKRIKPGNRRKVRRDR